MTRRRKPATKAANRPARIEARRPINLSPVEILAMFIALLAAIAMGVARPGILILTLLMASNCVACFHHAMRVSEVATSRTDPSQRTIFGALAITLGFGAIASAYALLRLAI